MIQCLYLKLQTSVGTTFGYQSQPVCSTLYSTPCPTPPLRAFPLCASMSGEHQVWSNDDGDDFGGAGEGARDLKPTSQTEVATGPRGSALARDLVRGGSFCDA